MISTELPPPEEISFPNGERQIVYRDFNGKFISKEDYEKLKQLRLINAMEAADEPSLITNQSAPIPAETTGSVISQSGGVGIEGDATIDGDVVGRDKIVQQQVLTDTKSCNSHRQDNAALRDCIKRKRDAARKVHVIPKFEWLELRDNDLSDMELEKCEFHHSTFVLCDFTGTRFIESSLENCTLEYAKLVEARCAKTNFRNARLRGANAQRANFQNATLIKTRLEQADLSHSDLRGSNLSGAVIRRTDFTGVRIDDTTVFDPAVLHIIGASKGEYDLEAVRAGVFENQIIIGGQFARRDLTGARFVRADLTNADMYGAIMDNILLQGAVLGGADLRHAKLKNAQMNSVYLGNARLRDADLRDADLTNADCTNADFLLADLTNADFSRANLSKAKHLTQSQLDSAKSLARAIMPDGTVHP